MTPFTDKKITFDLRHKRLIDISLLAQARRDCPALYAIRAGENGLWPCWRDFRAPD
jgi:hypothetical protein